MKLLFVHERFGAWAGAEANLLATAMELKQRSFETGILHGPGTGKGEAVWRETFSACLPLALRGGARRAASAVDQFQPDVVYVHKLSDLPVLAQLADGAAPVVRMVHDHDLYCLRSYKYDCFTRKICGRAASPYCIFPCGGVIARNRAGRIPIRWVSYSDKKKELRINRRFDRMIVATEYMKQELLRNGFDPARIEIHAPVPPRDASGVRGSFSERNRLIFAGQIIRGKGVDVLLESLAKIRVPFECLILGDGNHRAECEALSRKLGLEDRVRFEGYVPQEKLGYFYRDGSVAVLSSVWPEPFGAVGLEAMRYGLPVVAFDAGGIKEWLFDGRNGFLVPWMDRAQFAARVEQLLLDKTLARQMGERARQLVAEHYGFSNYIAGLETLFRQVISERYGEVPA